MGERAAKVAVGMSTAAAIAAALAWVNSRRAQAAPGGEGFVLPEELVNLIAAIAASADGVDDNTQQIIEEIAKLSIDVQGFPDNVTKIQTVRVVCTIAARAYQLPDLDVPNGMRLLISAWPLNVNLIYVGEDQSAATNANRVYALAAGANIGYQVKNAREIWVSAVVAGNSVSVTCEKPSSPWVGGG